MSQLIPEWYDVPEEEAEPLDAGVEHVGGTEADDMDIYFKQGSDDPKPPQTFKNDEEL
jgi:hypothetical protein